MHKEHQRSRKRVCQTTAKNKPSAWLGSSSLPCWEGNRFPSCSARTPGGSGTPGAAWMLAAGCTARLVFTEAARGCWGERCANRLREDPPPWRASGLIGTKETFAEAERGQRAAKCFSQGHLWQGRSWGAQSEMLHSGLGATFPPGCPAARQEGSSPWLSEVWRGAG